MRPLHDEHHGTTACNDADPCPTLRTGVRAHLSSRTSRCPSGDRSANWAIIASLTSSYGCSIRGCNGSACPSRTDAQGKPAIHYTTVYKVFAKWADDGSLWQAFVASVRHLAAEKQLDPACSMATGPTPWPKKGRWHWLLGPQTPEGREGHRHHRQPWLRLSACPRGSRQ